MPIPRPSRRFVLLLASAALPAALATVSVFFGLLALAITVATVALFLFDARLAANPMLEVRRLIPGQVMRQQPFVVRTEAHNHSPRPATLTVVDRLPENLEPQQQERSIHLAPHASFVEEIQVVATRRGAYKLLPPVVECATPLGLGIATIPASLAGQENLAVLPDLATLGRFDALARQRQLHEMGVARVRQRGEGTEIAGLRPYALGDPYARIDWKATARRASLISREMHTERRQNVVLLVDCGRRMARESEDHSAHVNSSDGSSIGIDTSRQPRSRLDYAIEAALLLAHVALRTDDRVGLVAFADRILRVVPPVRGHASASIIAKAIFGLEPVLLEPPYETVAAAVSRGFPRRSFLILFTDGIEPASLESLVKPIHFLGRRHLVLCVVFQDPSIERALKAPLSSPDALYLAGAAAELAVERERGLCRLREAGALVLEAQADQLSTTVVNRYLQVKARRLL
ncbi:MAG: DUF58 domain-containing protein [Pseudomonadota bacterium]